MEKIGGQVWPGEHFSSSLEAGQTHGPIFTWNAVKTKASYVLLKKLCGLEGLGIQLVNKELEKCEAALL
jgi:hypothetical protein